MADPSELPRECPICGGRMDVVYQRYGQTVVVCVDCHTGLTIPAAAGEVARRKRNGTRPPRKPHDDD